MAYCKVEVTDGYTVMANHHLRDKRLTLKAKGLLSLIFSLPPDWDMTIEGLAAISIECSDTISGIIKELESAGYISRYRERREDGRYGQTIYSFFQKPLNRNPVIKPNRKKSGQVKPVQENSGQLSKEQSIKEETNKDFSDILSINQTDAMNEIEIYRAIVYENISYESLRYQYNPDRLDEITEIMLECICSSADTIRVGREDVPAELVKSRFLKINSEHIEYVLSCLASNTTKVRNIKAYLRTALYNAPITMNSYYTAEVNHDMYGKGESDAGTKYR